MTTDPGARAAGRFAQVLAAAHEATRARLAPMEQAVKHQAVEALMEKWERNLADFNRQFVDHLVNDPEVSEADKAKLRSLVEPTHQTDFIIGTLTAFMAIFAIGGAIQSGNVDKWRAWGYRHVQERRLSPEELALGVIKGVIATDEGEHWAQDWGLTPARFEQMVRIMGNPPGPQELLAAYRRGIIDDHRLEAGIRQSNLRNEWTDVVKALRFQPPGAATAIEAAVQNHLPDSEARRKAEEAGLDPANFDWMYALAGNPPGNEHMIDLMHRGAMTRAEVEQGMRESRLKNKYIAPMIDGGYHLPPMRTVIALGHKGLLTKDQVITKLLQLGFHHEDAAVMAQEATADKLAGAKDLARAQIVAGYEERFFDRARAVALLAGLGYDVEEAGFMLDLADHDREKKFTNAATARFHTLYVRRRIDRPGVSTALDKLGIPASQRDDLLTLWDLERGADTPDLSTAQWQGLLRRGVVDRDRFVGEMLKKGWTDEEANFLGFLAFPPGKATGP
jgi:hypothetical protein